jgi:hypothetical protein
MGLILRGSHNSLPVGATISGTRLTVEQMDNNFIFLQNLYYGDASILTNTEALNLIDTNGIQQGAHYLIKGAHPGLYGTNSSFTYGLLGTDIILTGLDSSHFSTNGYGKFYNPNYASYSMWNAGNTYSIGDAVIFGGQVWINTSGDVGNTLGDGYDSSSFISLDSGDWQVQGYTNSSYYNVAWDEVEYDIVDDFITSRYEALNNNYVNNASKTFWFYCEINPIQSFKWGTPLGGSNNINNCEVIDSYFGCLNTISFSAGDIILTGNSWIYNITTLNNAYFYSLKLSNGSGINSCTVDASNISYVSLDNQGSIYDFTLESGSISYVTLNNYSYMDDFGLSASSSLGYITLDNYSYMESFSLGPNSVLEYFNFIGDSGMYNFSLYSGSYIEYITLSNNSYIRNVYLHNSSYFSYLDIKNTSSITGVLLCNNSGSNSYISNLEISNNSNLWDDDDSISLDDGSYMDRIKIDLYSAITSVTMGGNSESEIYMRDIIVSNRSLIDNIHISSSGFNAYFSSITLVDSNAQDIDIANSYIDYIDITDGSIDSLNLINNSHINDIKVNGGGISRYNLIVETSDNIYLDNSYMEFITLDQSIISGYMLMNGSSLSNLHLSEFSTIVGGFREDGDSVIDIGEYNYIIGLTSSNITNISLENNSIFGLGNITLNNSTMNDLSFNNNSKVAGFILLDSATMSNFKLENNSYFGRGNDISDGYSNSIQLINNSTINYLDMTNNAVIDGFLYMDNSSLIDITLSGTPDANDGSSPGSFNNYDIDNETGIVFGGGMELYDSYMKDIEITNGSYMTGVWGNEIYLESSSYMQGIKADNGSIINDVFLNGAFMKEIEVLNGSYIYNIDLVSGSSITYLSVSNYSFFGDYIYLQGASYMTFIKIDNNSQILGNDYGWGDIYLYGGYSNFQNITVRNNSSISNIILDNDGSEGGSFFKNIEISNNSYLANINPYNSSYLDTILVSNNSGIDSIWLCDDSGSHGYMYNVTVTNNSYITDDGDHIYIEDSGYMSNIYLNNYGYLSGYIEMYDNSYMYDLKIENDSYLGYNLNLEAGSHISYVSLDNNSYIDGDFLMVSSYIEYITMKNNSYISGNSEIYGVYINNLDLVNSSNIYDLNMSNSSIIFSKLSNQSKIYSNTFANGSIFSYITLDNESYIYNNTLDTSSIEYTQMNDSTIFNNTLTGGVSIGDLILNASEIHGSVLDNSVIAISQLYNGTIHNINMHNSYMINCLFRSSMLDTITFTSSTFGSVELTNDSSIISCFFTNNGLFNSSLMSSNINATTLNEYGIEFLYMRDSNFSEYSSTASVYNLDMLGTTLNFNGDSSYIIPNYTKVDTNTIKYQFSFTFDGTSGYGEIGAVDIPKLLSPNGWYIEKVIIDNSNTGTPLAFSGTYSYINIGNTTDSDTGLDNTKGDVSVMSSRITVSDISNGGADGMKTSGYGNVVMNVEGNNITAGEIYVEVILKNTNYGTNND